MVNKFTTKRDYELLTRPTRIIIGPDSSRLRVVNVDNLFTAWEVVASRAALVVGDLM